MNLLDLHKSSVHFDEQSHTYTTADGVALSGVTSIMSQVGHAVIQMIKRVV